MNTFFIGIIFFSVAVICFFIKRNGRLNSTKLDDANKWAGIISAILSALSFVVAIFQYFSSATPNDRMVVSNGVGMNNSGSGNQSYTIIQGPTQAPTSTPTPTFTPTPTPIPTPSPQSHVFDIPANGIDKIEFKWEPTHKKTNDDEYGSILALICTPSIRYWIYSVEKEPDPKELTKNMPVVKDTDCINVLIANNVTPYDLIQTDIGVIDDIKDPYTESIPMRSFYIRRTDANDIKVTEMQLTSRTLKGKGKYPFGCIDTPSSEKINVLSGDSGVGGWALSEGSIITKVEIWIDDKFYGLATYGIEREDTKFEIVGTGWHFNLDTRALANGLHHIKVKATSADGVTANIACGVPTIYKVPVEIKN